MRIFYLFSLIYIISAHPLLGQADNITGTIIDDKGMPLQHVIVECKEQHKRTTTDKDGNFALQIEIPATISAQLLGYLPYKHTIKETRPLRITLEADVFPLPEINISLNNEPVVLEKNLRLIDFEIKNDEVWTLYAYKKGHRIKVEDLKTSSIHNYRFRKRVDAIEKSAHNILYLHSDDSIYFIDHDTTLVHFYSLSHANYKTNIEPLVGYNYPMYYYKSGNRISQQTFFYAFNRDDGKMNCFFKYMNYSNGKRNIEDAGRVGLTARNLEEETHKDGRAANNVALNSSMRKAQMELDFYDKIIFTPIVCELKIFDDSLFIFNFDNDSISVYDSNRNYCRRLKLGFDKSNVQERQIVMDENKSSIYFTYVNKGILHINEINPHTGKAITSSKINGIAFPKKMRIYNKDAYFIIWDKQEELGKLFKQKL